MKKTVYISLFMLAAACSEEKPPEVISFQELTGDTVSESPEMNADQNGDGVFIPNLTPFIKSQLSIYDTIGHKKVHPLDRFGYASSYKLDFRGKSDIPSGEKGNLEPVASLYLYTFSDSLKTKNAFYNWLDCFGPGCDEIQLKKDVDKLSVNPGFTLIYDTTIVTVEYLCEQEKYNWRSFEDSLVQNFGKSHKYRMETKCNGPLRWR